MPVDTQQQYCDNETIIQMVSNTLGGNTLFPTGVPDAWDWHWAGRINLGDDCGSFNWAVPWGTVYIAEGQAADPNVLVEVSNLSLYVLSKTTGDWIKITSPYGIDGALYGQDFAGEVSTSATRYSDDPETFTTEVGGSDAFHFYFGNFRAELDPADIAGVIVTYDARIVSKDGLPIDADGKYIANTGLDYWSSATSLWDGQGVNNKDAFVGSFMPLTSSFQKVYGTTLSVEQLLANPPPAELAQYANGRHDYWSESQDSLINSDGTILEVNYAKDGTPDIRLYDADHNLLAIKYLAADGTQSINFFTDSGAAYSGTVTLDVDSVPTHASFVVGNLNYSYEYSAGTLISAGVYDLNWSRLGYATYDDSGNITFSTGQAVEHLDFLPIPLENFKLTRPQPESEEAAGPSDLRLYDADQNLVGIQSTAVDGTQQINFFSDNGDTYVGTVNLDANGIATHSSLVDVDGLNYSYDYLEGKLSEAGVYDNNWVRLGYAIYDSSGKIVWSTGEAVPRVDDKFPIAISFFGVGDVNEASVPYAVVADEASEVEAAKHIPENYEVSSLDGQSSNGAGEHLAANVHAHIIYDDPIGALSAQSGAGDPASMQFAAIDTYLLTAGDFVMI